MDIHPIGNWLLRVCFQHAMHASISHTYLNIFALHTVMAGNLSLGACLVSTLIFFG